jgi:hypothetical protein
MGLESAGLMRGCVMGGDTSGDDGKWGKLSKLSSKIRRKKVIWLQT